jgi:hypothetical protein
VARTFTPLTGTGAGSALILNDKFGFQSAEKIRQALDLLANIGAGYPLGGDERSMIVTTPATYQAVNGPITWDLNGDNFGGMTLEVVFFSYTSNAATSVTPRFRNTTDSTTAAQGAAVTATTVTREVVTVTLASGIKTYRLEWTASNSTNGVYCWAVTRFRKVPA